VRFLAKFVIIASIPACDLMAHRLISVAKKHPATKFVKIVGDHCIPNYPDRNLPTLLVYGKGDMQRQQIGLLGLGGPLMTDDGTLSAIVFLFIDLDLESFLASVGAIESENKKKRETFVKRATKTQPVDGDDDD
jgi:hypothetical protein